MALPDTLDPKTVLTVDPWLENNVPAIVHRYSLFKNWKDNIDNNEGGYEKFMRGNEKMGFVIAPDGSVTYREWAPGAKEAVLIGDFSGSLLAFLALSNVLNEYMLTDKWNRISHPMQKDAYGVWSITLPPKSPGVCAIPHDSKVKVPGFIHNCEECMNNTCVCYRTCRSP
jgi:1,4-alpha-glucan branching enzyme